MSNNPYKLSATLSGHTQDVRCVSSTSNGNVLSSSRDKTARSWSNDDTSSNSWTTTSVYSGHENFVNAVCSVTCRDGTEYAVTGSGDSTIMLWDAATATTAGSSKEPVKMLIGHEGNVCALHADNETEGARGLLASGSWDGTAKIWDLNDNTGDSKFTLKGAEQAIWAVLILPTSTPDQIYVLTASADKLIRLYCNSSLISTFKGHTQPVRALALLPETSIGEPHIFASAGNDGLIKIWNWQQGGEALRTLEGHESFVYSLCVARDGTLVSSGEDRSVRVWDKLTGELRQIITIPAISVWSVSILSGTSDIIVGSSDSLIRIFSTSPSRHAPSDQLAAYDEAVSSSSIAASSVVGDIKKSDLEDESSLSSKSGKKEGEIAMVKNASGGVEAYQWSASEREWKKVGQVVDAVGSGRKQVFEGDGKEYDYVFDVDVSEGQPPLKLPYNVAQNPYEAAQTFLNKNELPQSYIDQVVQFIEKNTAGATLGTSGNSDPYTGGGSYRSTGPPSASAGGGFSGDPWSNGASASSSTQALKLLPHKTFLTFSQANLAAIQKKIFDLNKQLSENPTTATEYPLDSADISTLQATITSLTTSPSTFSLDVSSYTILERLLDWPVSSRFPVLDLIRVISLHNSSSSSSTTSLIFQVLSNLTPNSTASQKENETNSMLACRAIANMFNKGKQGMRENAPEVLETLSVVGTEGMNKLGKTALATVALNYSVLAVEGALQPQSVALLIDLIEHLLQDTDPETLYRTLVALGNVAFSPESSKGSLQVGKMQSLKSRAQALAGTGDQRIKDVVKELMAKL